jgi:hypothetical protein
MPLDSNLPTYYFKPPPNDKTRGTDATLLFTQFDSDPEPRYILRYPDPTSPQGKNCYAAALFDAYIPDVVFGEVLVKPEWTHTTLSQDEIRKNGGVPPAPVPVIPKQVSVQLYAPDQQIVVEEQPGSWGNAATYHFQMPQQTFRLPSASSLDYSANDPAADATTPQINFLWKRDGRKDLKCFVTGKSTDNGKKKKGGREPPIIVAIFQDFKDLTIYEPNLHRVEMEDYKGLEVTLLLSATVVRDMWCGQKKDVFNSGEAPRKNSAGGGLLAKKPSIPLLTVSTANLPASSAQLQANGLPGKAKRQPSIPPPDAAHPHGVPAPDPRQKWEIDAETARLQKLYTNERLADEAKRKERARRDEEEQKRIRKMLEQEEKETRKQQAAIDKESARLMKLYGHQPGLAPPRPQQPPQRQSFPPWGHGPPPPQQPPRPQQQPRPSHGPYLQPNGLLGGPSSGRPPAASQSSFFSGPGPRPQPQPRPQQPPSMSGAIAPRPPRPVSEAPSHSPELRPKKSSFWGFLGGDPQPRLRSQRSTMF